MKTLGTALGAAAVGTAQQSTTTPFLPHRTAIACIEVSPNWNGTVIIQGSDDGVTYTDLLTVAGTSQPNAMTGIGVKKFMRVNVTVWVAGTANAYLLGDS